MLLRHGAHRAAVPARDRIVASRTCHERRQTLELAEEGVRASGVCRSGRGEGPADGVCARVAAYLAAIGGAEHLRIIVRRAVAQGGKLSEIMSLGHRMRDRLVCTGYAGSRAVALATRSLRAGAGTSAATVQPSGKHELGLLISACGVSSSATRPVSSTMTRSLPRRDGRARRRKHAIGVPVEMVWPVRDGDQSAPAEDSRIVAWTSASVRVSMAAVASSRTRIREPRRSARAMQMSCATKGRRSMRQ